MLQSVFCETLGGGVIGYPYPKFQFADIQLDELFPWDWQRICIICNCILHCICIKTFSFSLDFWFSFFKYSINSFVVLLSNNLLKALTALFKPVSSFNFIFLYWQKSCLTDRIFVFCGNFWRISFFCLSASCSHLVLYFSFFFAFCLFWCWDRVCGPYCSLRFPRISRSNKLVKLYEPLRKSFILNEIFYSTCGFL